MTNLEKLITALCELPSIDLEGDDGDNLSVRWCTKESNQPFIILEDWGDRIYLNPAQALVLLSWLREQRGNLEELQEVLHAQQIQDAATKAQRDAERLNVLKAKHSDAVVAWQQADCVGPCPSFDDIVFKEQFVGIRLDATPAIPLFVKQYPILERLRKQQESSIIPVISTPEELNKAIRNGDQVVFMDTQGRDLATIEQLRKDTNNQ